MAISIADSLAETAGAFRFFPEIGPVAGTTLIADVPELIAGAGE